LCISAPIKDYFWPVALSLVGPVNRLEPRVDEIIKEVVTSANHITGIITEFFKAKGVIASEQVIKKKQPIQYP